MISVNCGDCGKEHKISGADFDEQKAAGLRYLCPVCRVKPVVKKIVKPVVKKVLKKYGK